MACCQSRFDGLVVLHKAAGRGLAGAVRPPAGAGRDLCRPDALSRHRLSRGELALPRPEPGLQPHPGRLQRYRCVAQEGLVKALQADARTVLSRSVLDPSYRMGAPRIMLTADQMRSLPDFFADIPDPRRRQGRRHPLPAILAIAAGAILCGMRGYKAIAEWADNLTPKARQRFRCRRD